MTLGGSLGLSGLQCPPLKRTLTCFVDAIRLVKTCQIQGLNRDVMTQVKVKGRFLSSKQVVGPCVL